MKINRERFFNSVRKSLFGGKLTADRVSTMDTFFDQWEYYGLADIRWLAYMLATTYWETARTMMPIAEYGKGKGRKYGVRHPKTGQVYYGRGFVQLTWYANYLKMGKLLGIADLVTKPDRALEPAVATEIMFEGMTTGKSFAGDFTGKHLGNYFNAKTNDPIGARRIINGNDKAKEIAEIYKKFLVALT